LLALGLAAVQGPSSGVVGGALVAPRVVVAASDPSDPFVIPHFDETTILKSPDEIRTGGVNCAPPDVPAASNAGDGSGNGYRIPFRIAMTDGRVLGGYSQPADEAGKYPFKSGGFGLTGWVTGWVEIPSMRFVVPQDGVVLCPGGKGFWHFSSSEPNGDPPPYGMFLGMSAYPGGGIDMEVSLESAGPAATTLTGVTASGELQVKASLSVNATFSTITTSGERTNICTATTDISLSTDPTPPPSAFASVRSNLSANPDHWAVYDFYTAQYDFSARPPKRTEMPTRALSSAVEGGKGTIGSATLGWPAMDGPEGVCNQPSAYSTALAPIDPATGDQPPGVWVVFFYFTGLAGLIPAFDVPPGALQTSLDLSVDSVGLTRGVPAGFGFE
jgi:hypothetical protein